MLGTSVCDTMDKYNSCHVTRVLMHLRRLSTQLSRYCLRRLTCAEALCHLVVCACHILRRFDLFYMTHHSPYFGSIVVLLAYKEKGENGYYQHIWACFMAGT